VAELAGVKDIEVSQLLAGLGGSFALVNDVWTQY
jgi:hypothetical protein